MIEVVKETLRLKDLVKELKVQEIVIVYGDNNNIVKLFKNQVYYGKLIVKLHLMRKEIR